MNTSYGRYGAAYNMVGLICFNEELLCVWVELCFAKESNRGKATSYEYTW
jgi:hypothetical protein